MVCQTDRVRRSLFGRFLSDKTGATAVEYGLLAVLLALAIALAIFTVGDNLLALFESAAEPFEE